MHDLPNHPSKCLCSPAVYILPRLFTPSFVQKCVRNLSKHFPEASVSRRSKKHPLSGHAQRESCVRTQRCSRELFSLRIVRRDHGLTVCSLDINPQRVVLSAFLTTFSITRVVRRYPLPYLYTPRRRFSSLWRWFGFLNDSPGGGSLLCCGLASFAGSLLPVAVSALFPELQTHQSLRGLSKNRHLGKVETRKVENALLHVGTNCSLLCLS